MSVGVYRIDLGGGWFYVGSSQNLARREARHRRDFAAGSHCNRIMQRVFDKYGVFEFTVTERCAVDELLPREQALLDMHHGDHLCANIAPTAGNCRGVKHSDATRAKMSAASTGRKHSKIARANMSAAYTVRTLSPEQRARMSAAQLGKKASRETRAKMSAAQMGKTLSPEHRAKIGAAQKSRYVAEALAAQLLSDNMGAQMRAYEDAGEA